MNEFEGGEYYCTAITTADKLVNIAVNIEELRNIRESGIECQRRNIRWLYQFYPYNRPYFFVCTAVLGPYIIDPERYTEWTRGEN